MRDFPPHIAAVLLLTIAAVGWYAASRAAEEVLAAGKPITPGRRALAYSLSTVLVAVLSILLGRPEIAVGVVFATSVASMTLVLGIVTVNANHTRTTQRRRIWGFILPVALISLLLGLRGAIGAMQAIFLLLEGIVLLMLWNDAPEARLADTDAGDWSAAMRTTSDAAPPAVPIKPLETGFTGLTLVQMFIAVIASLVASWAGITSVRHVSTALHLTSSGVITALMLAPAMVLPMIGAGSVLSSEGKYDHAVATLVGFVMLQLCAVLPMSAGLWLSRPIWNPPLQAMIAPLQRLPQVPVTADAPTTLPATYPSTARSASTTQSMPSTQEAGAPDVIEDHPLAYPMAVWRVDTVLLIAVGLMLLPVSLGRWTLGGIEGTGLICAYVVYMTLTAIISR